MENSSRTADITIIKNAEDRRYEAHKDGSIVGVAEYEIKEDTPTGRILFTHTAVLPEHEGQGIASTLIRFAMDDVRATGALRVRPICPYVAEWLRRHPEYHDLQESSHADEQS